MTDKILRRAAAPWRRLWIVPALLVSLLVPWAGCEAPPEPTPPPDSPPPVKDELTDLDRYVRTPDPSYAWELAKTETGTGYTAFLLKMKSLTWRSSAEVDRTLALVEGKGLVLNVGVRAPIGLRNAYDPLPFPGDEATRCTLFRRESSHTAADALEGR